MPITTKSFNYHTRELFMSSSKLSKILKVSISLGNAGYMHPKLETTHQAAAISIFFPFIDFHSIVADPMSVSAAMTAATKKARVRALL